MATSTILTTGRILLCTAVLLTVAFILTFHENVANTFINLHIGGSHEQSLAGSTQHSAKSNPAVYLRDHELEDLGSRGDAAWARLTTPRGGFLWVQYNDTLDIQYGISMFHGLHCLQMLRTEFKNQLGLATGSAGPDHDHDHDHDHHNTQRSHRRRAAVQGETTLQTHLGHCLAYVAMLLQCAGDSTIEHPRMHVDAATGHLVYQGVDGHEAQHQCRNTQHLWDLAEESERQPVSMWEYEVGDTVEKLFSG